ncbi:MAG: hypothetical protein IKZ82_06035 [Clostridia bacterium]|nr:hypothetical protein [Clostridia bacterium]
MGKYSGTHFYVDWLRDVYEAAGASYEKTLDVCFDALHDAFLIPGDLTVELAGNDTMLALANKLPREELSAMDIQKAIVETYKATVEVFHRSYPNLSVHADIKGGRIVVDHSQFFEAFKKNNELKIDRSCFRRFFQDWLDGTLVINDNSGKAIPDYRLDDLIPYVTEEGLRDIYWASDNECSFEVYTSRYRDFTKEQGPFFYPIIMLRKEGDWDWKILGCFYEPDLAGTNEVAAELLAKLIRTRRNIPEELGSRLCGIAGLDEAYWDADKSERDLIVFEAAEKLGVVICQ